MCRIFVNTHHAAKLSSRLTPADRYLITNRRGLHGDCPTSAMLSAKFAAICLHCTVCVVYTKFSTETRRRERERVRPNVYFACAVLLRLSCGRGRKPIFGRSQHTDLIEFSLRHILCDIRLKRHTESKRLRWRNMSHAMAT